MAKKSMVAVVGVGAAPAEVTGEFQPEVAPIDSEIAELAYSYWEARGYQGGSPEEDWFRAEQELRAESQEQT